MNRACKTCTSDVERLQLSPKKLNHSLLKRTPGRIGAFWLGIALLMGTGVTAWAVPQGKGQEATRALTNKDVVGMVEAGLSPEIIVAKIKASTCDFDTSPATLKQLKAARVPDAVILAMVQVPQARADQGPESQASKEHSLQAMPKPRQPNTSTSLVPESAEHTAASPTPPGPSSPSCGHGVNPAKVNAAEYPSTATVVLGGSNCYAVSRGVPFPLGQDCGISPGTYPVRILVGGVLQFFVEGPDGNQSVECKEGNDMPDGTWKAMTVFVPDPPETIDARDLDVSGPSLGDTIAYINSKFTDTEQQTDHHLSYANGVLQMTSKNLEPGMRHPDGTFDPSHVRIVTARADVHSLNYNWMYVTPSGNENTYLISIICRGLRETNSTPMDKANSLCVSTNLLGDRYPKFPYFMIWEVSDEKSAIAVVKALRHLIKLTLLGGRTDDPFQPGSASQPSGRESGSNVTSQAAQDDVDLAAQQAQEEADSRNRKIEDLRDQIARLEASAQDEDNRALELERQNGGLGGVVTAIGAVKFRQDADKDRRAAARLRDQLRELNSEAAETLPAPSAPPPAPTYDPNAITNAANQSAANMRALANEQARRQQSATQQRSGQPAPKQTVPQGTTARGSSGGVQSQVVSPLAVNNTASGATFPGNPAPWYVAFYFSYPNPGTIGGDGAWGVGTDTVSQSALNQAQNLCESYTTDPGSCSAGGVHVGSQDGSRKYFSLAIGINLTKGVPGSMPDGEGLGFADQASADANALANCGGGGGCKVVCRGSVPGASSCGGAGPSVQGSGQSGGATVSSAGLHDCVRAYFDPTVYNWLGFQNNCSKALSITWFWRQGDYGGSSGDAQVGASVLTGFSKADIQSHGDGWEVYPCPLHYIPVDTNGHVITNGGASPQAYVCKQQ